MAGAEQEIWKADEELAGKTKKKNTKVYKNIYGVEVEIPITPNHPDYVEEEGVSDACD